MTISPPLTSNERKALTSLQIVEWENPAQLYVGRKTTIQGLLDKGFIEHHSLSMPGYEKFRITADGQKALDAQIQEKPTNRHKLRMLEPRIKAADLRTVRPAKKR
jgi:hypothetical protein